jgi:hypothetical protein
MEKCRRGFVGGTIHREVLSALDGVGERGPHLAVETDRVDASHRWRPLGCIQQRLVAMIFLALASESRE